MRTSTDRLNASGKAHEDIGLAIQWFVNQGDTQSAQTIELVAACRAGDMRRMRDDEGVRSAEPAGNAEQVFDIATRIMQGGSKFNEVPLVRLGQGDYTRDIQIGRAHV